MAGRRIAVQWVPLRVRISAEVDAELARRAAEAQCSISRMAFDIIRGAQPPVQVPGGVPADTLLASQ